MLQSILKLPVPGTYTVYQIMNMLLRETTFPSNKLMQLRKGDITLSDVDVIVNPANSHLNHGGGLAGFLAKKAGSALQQESAEWIKTNGPVSHESPAYTGAGNLPFQYIIHAVGPIWGSGQEDKKLEAAVNGTLDLANELNVQSIAIPAISTGVFGYPMDGAANVIISTIKGYLISNSNGSLSTVQLVVFNDQAVTSFSDIWDQILK